MATTRAGKVGGAAHRSKQRTRWERAEWNILAPAMLELGLRSAATFAGRELAGLAFEAQALLPPARQRDRASVYNTATAIEQSFLNACLRLRLRLPDSLRIAHAPTLRPREISLEAEAWIRGLVDAAVRERLAQPHPDPATLAARAADAALSGIMQRAATGAAPVPGQFTCVDVVGLTPAERAPLMQRQRAHLPTVMMRFIEPTIAPARWANRVVIVRCAGNPADLAPPAPERVVYQVTPSANKVVDAVFALLVSLPAAAAPDGIAVAR